MAIGRIVLGSRTATTRQLAAVGSPILLPGLQSNNETDRRYNSKPVEIPLGADAWSGWITGAVGT